MILDDLETTLSDALQCDVSFMLKDKTLREGKLILYTIKDFYITFVLVTKNDVTKTYEVPVPFKFKKEQDQITFDYSVAHLHKNRRDISYLIAALHKKIGKKSKLFNNTLTIHLRK